ncbi:hypothetical protein HK104_009284 [Borealophlyctis nickersoniae]|nr:hypothetical protein HK104_009284 [Borealophlyctis nickersoniae]
MARRHLPNVRIPAAPVAQGMEERILAAMQRMEEGFKEDIAKMREEMAKMKEDMAKMKEVTEELRRRKRARQQRQHDQRRGTSDPPPPYTH